MYSYEDRIKAVRLYLKLGKRLGVTIRYVSPQQRHTGEVQAVLAARHALYTKARERHPARWARHTGTAAPWGRSPSNPNVTPLSRSTYRKRFFSR